MWRDGGVKGRLCEGTAGALTSERPEDDADDGDVVFELLVDEKG